MATTSVSSAIISELNTIMNDKASLPPRRHLPSGRLADRPSSLSVVSIIIPLLFRGQSLPRLLFYSISRSRRLRRRGQMELWIIYLPLLFVLIGSTYTDLMNRVIPNRLIWIGLGYMLLARLFISDQAYWQYILGVVAASGLMYLAALLIPGSFGGGDIKLLAVVGAAIGWWKSLVFLWLLLGLSGVFAVFCFLFLRKRNLKIAMAPFFLVACILMWLYPMENWI